MSSLYNCNWVRTFGGAAFLTCFAACAASASITQPDPTLPPENGGYVTAGAIYTCFATHMVCIDNATHFGFTGASTSEVGSDQHLLFNSQFTGEVFNPSGTIDLGPIHLFGPVGVTIFGRSSPTQTGTFSTQMTGLDLTGTFGGSSVEIKVDPTHPTTGMTTVTPSGGQFMISSFFDVFTDLSIDNDSFEPSMGAAHVTLQQTPEPGTALLFGTGLLAVAR